MLNSKPSRMTICVISLCLISTCVWAKAPQPWDETRELWFNTPAAEWNHPELGKRGPGVPWRIGLPVGNGRLGAMVLGTFPKERIQLNEDSIWAKAPLLRHPETTKDHIAQAQALVEAGKYRAAHDLFQSKIIMSKSPSIGSYQTMGDLWIEHVDAPDLKLDGYSRKLDLATGLVTVTKPLSDGSTITQQVISSAPDDCIAIRLTTTSPKGLNFNVSMSRPHKTFNPAVVKGSDQLIMDEQARYENPKSQYLGTKFRTIIKAIPETGTVKGHDGVLQVRNAKAVTLLLTCSTDFNKAESRSPLTNNWQKKAANTLKKAQRKSWKKIKKASIADVSEKMYRCDVDLGTTPQQISKLPTDQRLTRFAKTQMDTDLLELYFQFGRYLKISSSRPGTLPTNLQGIWADGIRNMWNCDYHLNINIQLHYLLAEPTNLSECHEPLFWLLNMLREEGRHMAKAYGAKGFCTNHGVGPFGRTINKASRARWSASVISVHWVVQNIMERYRFTGDKKFLRKTGFPILTESAEFVESWVIRDKNTGKWVPKASCSHETGFSYTDENGKTQTSEVGPVTAYDQSVIWQVMTDYLQAAKILGVNDKFTKTIESKLAELELPRIGKHGRILEWGIEEAVCVEQDHRHLSHLLGLHPGSNQITKTKTPELFEAARKSLIHRGTPPTGWSECLKISLYARVFDGNAALGQFKQMLTDQTQPNLMNLAGPFLNLDSNYGTPAGVVEMLMQSHDDAIDLMPAMPYEWKNGTLKGAVARGGFEVDIEWKQGKLVKADFLSRLGNDLKIRYAGKTKTYKTKKGQRITFKP